MYASHRFMYPNPNSANQGVATDGSILDQYTLEMLLKTDPGASDSSVMVNSYVGAGTDFSLMFFLNVPTLFIYSSVPTAV